MIPNSVRELIASHNYWFIVGSIMFWATIFDMNERRKKDD